MALDCGGLVDAAGLSRRKMFLPGTMKYPDLEGEIRELIANFEFKYPKERVETYPANSIESSAEHPRSFFTKKKTPLAPAYRIKIPILSHPRASETWHFDRVRRWDQPVAKTRE